MIKLNEDEKNFLKYNREKIIKEDWVSFIDFLYSSFIYAQYPDLNHNKILNLLEEFGVDYKKYPKFKLGEAVKTIDAYEIVDKEDYLLPSTLRKYNDVNFVYVSDMYGVVEEIIPYFNGTINFLYIVKINDTDNYVLINQRGLRKI